MPAAHPVTPVFPPDPTLVRRFRLLAVFCWFLSLAIITTIDLGWLYSVSWATRFQVGAEMARPITTYVLAIGVVSLGMFLFLRHAWSRTWTRVTGLLVFGVTFISFVEHLIRCEDGISQFAFEMVMDAATTGMTPWMAPNAAASFGLIGIALFYLPSRNRRHIALSQWLAIFALIPVSLALLGYAYHVKPLFLIGKHTAMALPTAIGITSLAIGVVSIHVKRGPLAPLVSSNLAGYVLRRLLPAVVLVPPVMGWLRLQGQYANLYNLEIGVALFTAANILVLILLVIGVTRRMICLEHQLSHQREVNRTILETAPAALFILDAKNCVTFSNREVEPLFGWTPKALRNQPLQDRLLPHAADDRASAEFSLLAAARSGRSLRDHEAVFHTKDGRPVDVLCATVPLPAEEGQRGTILLAIDITSRKRALLEQRRSEERFSVISRITNDAIWDWDFATDTLWWSEGVEKLFGYSPNAVPRIITSWKERIHPEDRERVIESIDAVLARGGREWSAEYRFRAADGSDRTVADRGYVIRDEHGCPLRMLGGMTDISERKQAEEALHLAVRRFETLANLIPQIVWSTKPDGYHDYFNERWYEFTGMPRGDGQGWNWKNYIHPDDVATAVALWEDCLRTGKLYEVEYRFRRASDGAYVWFIGRALPIRDAEGRISRWFGTCTDIEDQRREGDRLEALVDERTARLRESVADLEHFSYTLTHDMRAPLRAMQGFAQLLLEEHATQLDTNGVEYLNRIMTAAERMDHLILDALNYSKVVKAELPVEAVETGPLLHSLIESYPEFQPPRAQIEVTDPLPTVLGNVSGLTQCFSNLLGNAVKFVTRGEQPRVRVWSEDRGDHVRLCVEDNGIGIPAAYRERIFMMFERLDPTYEGTGVGLALVRKVVERMHGRLGVDAAPEGGSRFWIELPKG